MTACGDASVEHLDVTEVEDRAQVWVNLMGSGGEPKRLFVKLDVPDDLNRLDSGRCWTSSTQASVNGIPMEVERLGGTIHSTKSDRSYCRGAAFVLRDIGDYPELFDARTTTVRIWDDTGDIVVETEGLFEEPSAELPGGVLVPGETASLRVHPPQRGSTGRSPSHSLAMTVARTSTSARVVAT